MRYLLAYFALMLGLSGISLLMTGRALGFLLVLIAAILVFILIRMEQGRRRDRRYGGYEDAIDGYEKRFGDAEQALEGRLPENELDSPAMLELLSAYGEDADDAEAVRDLYVQLRRRFREWREEFETLHDQNVTGAFGLPEELAGQYAELDRRLAQLLADVKSLEARADEIRRVTDDPLDKIAEGALKLEQAKAACARKFGNDVPDAVKSKLALAAAKLGEARAAIAAGAERPLDAVRLSEEVCALARAAQAATA
jgi:hypothetical protein